MPSKRGEPDADRGHSELELLRQLRRRAAAIPGSGVRLGIGDDCALLRLRPGEELALTTDLTIAGRHFRLDWHPPESVGHRTLARGLSDLAAMGARPVAAFLSLGLPGELTLPEIPIRPANPPRRVSHRDSSTWMSRFLDGLLALGSRHQTPLAGGDLAESPLAVADIVLAGAVPRGRALLRSGARTGDLLYVTGSLGGAAAALARLREMDHADEEPTNPLKASGFRLSTASSASHSTEGAGPGVSQSPSARSGATKKQPATAADLAPHLFPEPRIAQGLWLVRHRAASAAIDLSDGISTDLAHLCEESAVAAEIDSACLPIYPGATLVQALHGGEDYELLFTAPPGARLPRSIAGVAVSRIGRIVKRGPHRPTVTLAAKDGAQALEPHGWEHFS